MREPTAIDRIADEHTHALARLSPLSATGFGLPGYDHLMDDLSPDGHQELARLHRDTLTRVEAATPVDETDAVTVAALRDRLGLEIERVEAGEY